MESVLKLSKATHHLVYEASTCMQRVVCVCHVDLLLLQLVASIGVYLLARVLAFWLAVRRRSTCFPV